MGALSPYAIALVQNALLASFWRLEALRTFLRRSGIKDTALAQLHKGTTKRLYIEWLFARLEGTDTGLLIIKRMANVLAEQTAFPDLHGWEDSAVKLDIARRAVAALKEYLERLEHVKQDQEAKKRIREHAEQERLKFTSHAGRLTALKDGLETLLPRLGTQDGGYAFQDWFLALLDLFELDRKKPYRVDGREIDGSVTIDGTTYLLSLRFTKTPTAPEDVSAFRDRVRRGADNTMGIFVSMSGYTAVALEEAAGPLTPLLLLDYSHVYYVLSGVGSLSDVVARVRRHGSRTGRAYLAISDFGR